jgi:hypothetical protein
MAPSTKPNSHEAIWDDSALVDSWNDALEEYKVKQARSFRCREASSGADLGPEIP